ncbi:MAG: alpha/beta hydrolase [Planctomycetota bacterium]|nr:alpha/beta hydrolase [Planctomycetota bacterium]
MLGLMVLRILENRLIYRPMRELRGDPSRIGIPFEDTSIASADDVRLHGWWVPEREAGLAVLVLHGNSGNISYILEQIALFHALGVGILAVDYRGYGRSDGRPTEGGLYRDADAALRYLHEVRRFPLDRIVVFGKSLGGAVAVNLASKERVGGLIIESTFTTLKEFVRRFIRALPVHLLVQSRFDSLGKIRGVAGPILAIHGEEDEVVPIDLGRRLIEAAVVEKEFFAVPGANHDNVLRVGGDDYRTRLQSFFDQLSEKT